MSQITRARRLRTPWTVRLLQIELVTLAVLAVSALAAVAVIFIFLALISIDRHTAVLTIVVSAATSLGLLVGGSAICTGAVLLGRSLGRGSRPAWAGSLAAALVCAAALAWAGAAVVAPEFVLSPGETAIAAAALPALAALLLVAPPTLRVVRTPPRRGQTRALPGPPASGRAA